MLDVAGKPLTGKVRLFGLPEDTRDSTTVPPGGSGVMFFDVTYSELGAVPRLVGHLVSVVLPGSSSLATVTDPVDIGCEPAVRLSPPLIGHGWWNGNGCCETVNAHRGATLPVNGELRPPEQFAIDFMQIRPDGSCCTGPVQVLRSWPFHGAPILAAAAGKVVEAVDDQPDQVPGPPTGVTAATAPGNHVIQQIDDRHWILYAHMRPGSVSVHAGQAVRAGQQIGELGNSGSTTAPHLHFQVMDRPSALDSVGLPFVFDRQMVEGVVGGTPAQAEVDYEAGRAVLVNGTGVGRRREEMPAEGQVFGFHID